MRPRPTRTRARTCVSTRARAIHGAEGGTREGGGSQSVKAAAAGLETEVSCLFHGEGMHFLTSVSIVSGNVLGVALINRQACKLLHCINLHHTSLDAF